jgi:hypothetical protein
MDFEEVRKRIPPNNSLKRAIEELLSVCEKLASRYDGNRASTFNSPTTETEITNWETINNLILPKTYKDFLLFSNGGYLFGAQLYGVSIKRMDNPINKPVIDTQRLKLSTRIIL